MVRRLRKQIGMSGVMGRRSPRFRRAVLLVPVVLASSACDLAMPTASPPADGRAGVIVAEEGRIVVLYKACRTSDVDVSVFVGDGEPDKASNTTVWRATLSDVKRLHDVKLTVGKERVAHLETLIPLAEPLDPALEYTVWVRDGKSDAVVRFTPEALESGQVRPSATARSHHPTSVIYYQPSCGSHEGS